MESFIFKTEFHLAKPGVKANRLTNVTLIPFVLIAPPILEFIDDNIALIDGIETYINTSIDKKVVTIYIVLEDTVLARVTLTSYDARIAMIEQIEAFLSRINRDSKYN